VFERQRPAPLRLTFDASQENSSPLWSQDGKTIAFASLRGGMWGIYQKPADGAGEEQLLFQTKLQIMPKAWSPDGKVIVFWQRDTSSDLWTLPLGGERKPQPFLNSRFAESHGQVSPNGKWISYNSNESGRGEIYVRPFPSGPGRWQVSTSGGAFSRWRADGKELYYLTSASRGKLMAIEIKDGSGSFEYGTAKELFDSQYENYNHGNGGNWHTYAVTRDGQRFLIPRPLEAAPVASGSSFNVVLNWDLLLTK
jgi:Tol biopolymer transport system component